MISFRALLNTDLQAALRLCRVAGWNQSLEDWKLFLDHYPSGCRACVDETGTIVGTVTFVRYENRFGWIGMLLVDPAYRRQGIGSALLNEGLRLAGREFTVRLDATPAGREVYTRLGFRDEFSLIRMIRPASDSKEPASSSVRPMKQRDLLLISDMDGDIFGADRSELLRSVYALAPALCSVIQKGADKIAAYCLGRYGQTYTHIGPVIGEDINHAIALVSNLLDSTGTESFIIDVPASDESWKVWLQSKGFVEQRAFTRMVHGENRYVGMAARQFAILGPEFG